MLATAPDPKKTADALQDHINPTWQNMYVAIVSTHLVRIRRTASYSRSQLEQVLTIKFNTYSRLKQDLLATGEAELILVCSFPPQPCRPSHTDVSSLDRTSIGAAVRMETVKTSSERLS